VVDGDAVCTPIDPGTGSGPFCGGIAAIQCPGAGSCIDDPSDDCDPANGGADCGGVCECNALALCIEGSVFDESPDVCACVPAEPGPEPGSGPFCGGIAGIPCPGAGSCVDDPADDCDPENGGADCGGVCECNALALCIEGSVFDESPDVCACVPAEPELDPCAAVRCAAGTHCEVVGEGAICAPDEPVDPCAAVLCGPGKHCVARGEKARCVPARRGHDCRRDD
jgi:hypothetical protein